MKYEIQASEVIFYREFIEAESEEQARQIFLDMELNPYDSEGFQINAIKEGANK